MGMFDIFTSNQPAPTPAPTPAPDSVQQGTPVPPGNIPAPADPAIPGQGSVPSSAVQPVPTPKEPESPLDTFKDLWEPIPPDPNKPAPAVPQELTAEQVQKAVAKANFSQGITPEQLTAISAGGEEATKAFSQAINTVAQQVMVQATVVGDKLTKKAVADALKVQNDKLPQMLREQQSTSHLNDTSQLFSNPAIQPVVQATQAQLLQKFPNATPLEITQMTQDYIKAMGEAFAPKPPSDPNEQDWSNFLE